VHWRERELCKSGTRAFERAVNSECVGERRLRTLFGKGGKRNWGRIRRGRCRPRLLSFANSDACSYQSDLTTHSRGTYLILGICYRITSGSELEA